MFNWLWQNIFENVGNFLFVSTPLWVWIVVAALAAAWVWRTFGKEGLVALGLTILGFFSYRQGWKDSAKGDKPKVPINTPKQIPTKTTDRKAPTVRPRKRNKTLTDLFKRR
jgi:hypothetical protein